MLDLSVQMCKAAHDGKLEKLKALLSLDCVDVNCVDNNLQNVLHLSAGNGNLECCKFVLQHPQGKSLLKKKNRLENDTPIYYAIKSKNLAIVKLFEENGADLHQQNTFNMNLLHVAAMVGSPEIVEYLIGKGVDPNVKDKLGHTPSFYAKNPTIIKIFKGENPIVENPNINVSTIHIAAKKGDDQSIAPILESGVDPNISFEEATSFFEALPPLCIASFEGHLKVVQELLKSSKTKINIQTFILKQSPLHLASQEGHLDIVKYLIEKGANPNLKDYLGRTPAHLAKDFNQKEIYNFLKSKSDLNIRSNLGFTAHETVLNHWGIKEVSISKLSIDQSLEMEVDLKTLLNQSEHNFRFSGVKWNNNSFTITKYNLESPEEALKSYLEICKIIRYPFMLKIDTSRGPTPRIEAVCFVAGYLIIIQNPYKVIEFDVKEKHEKLNLLTQISSIISLIHYQGIVHKNLNLDNLKIYVTKKSNELTLCEGGLTIATKNKKNLRYQAPECKDGIFSVQSDSYSFGHLMYEAYFGKRMVEGKLRVPGDTPDSFLEVIEACVSEDYSKRPSFTEINEKLIEAKKEFAKHQIYSQAMKNLTGDDERKEFVTKLFKIQNAKSEKEVETNTKLTNSFSYRDEMKLIIFNEGNESFLKNKWKDVLGRIQKDVKEFLSRELTDEELKCLENCKKIIFDEPQNIELFNQNSVKILLNLINKLPEKKVFIIYDLLRYLILNPHCYTLLIHQNNQILQKVFSYKWKELETKATKTMILRFLCNLFQDEERYPFVEPFKYFQFVLDGLGDLDKSIQDHSLALACNLTTIQVFLNWKLLLQKLISISKESDLTKEMKSKILTLFHRFVRGNSENGELIKEISYKFEDWTGVNSKLLNSLTHLIDLYTA